MFARLDVFHVGNVWNCLPPDACEFDLHVALKSPQKPVERRSGSSFGISSCFRARTARCAESFRELYKYIGLVLGSNDGAAHADDNP